MARSDPGDRRATHFGERLSYFAVVQEPSTAASTNIKFTITHLRGQNFPSSSTRSFADSRVSTLSRLRPASPIHYVLGQARNGVLAVEGSLYCLSRPRGELPCELRVARRLGRSMVQQSCPSAFSDFDLLYILRLALQRLANRKQEDSILAFRV